MATVNLVGSNFDVNETESNVGCIIEWFLHKEHMSHKKIQKLSYYAQVWSLTLDNQDIVPGIEFEAWVHGPVNTDIWLKLKKFGWRNIMIDPGDLEESYELINDTLSDRQKTILDLVWSTYGEYSADELEAMTHIEGPWKIARRGLDRYDRTKRTISNESILDYYKDKFSYE